MKEERLIQRATEIFESKYTGVGFRWTVHIVADYFEESVQTTMALPSFRMPGLRKSLWSYIKHSPAELVEMQLKALVVRPTSDALSRHEKTLVWISWLTEEERELVWMRAARVGWSEIARKFKCHWVTAWRKWQDALTKIGVRLNKSGVMPDRRIYERSR